MAIRQRGPRTASCTVFSRADRRRYARVMLVTPISFTATFMNVVREFGSGPLRLEERRQIAMGKRLEVKRDFANVPRHLELVCCLIDVFAMLLARKDLDGALAAASEAYDALSVIPARAADLGRKGLLGDVLAFNGAVFHYLRGSNDVAAEYLAEIRESFTMYGFGKAPPGGGPVLYDRDMELYNTLSGFVDAFIVRLQHEKTDGI